MLDFFRHLFSTEGFPPRWYCGTGWTEGLGWLHVVSDVAIWGAYTAIPIVLGYFVLRRRDLPFPRVFLLFMLFIYACGAGHLVEALIFWWPAYRLSGLVKAITAIASWGTVAVLIPLTPKALQLPGLAKINQQLGEEMAARQQAYAQLQESEDRLNFALAAAEMGTWRVDLRSRLETRDAALNQVLGLPPVQTIQPIEDFLRRVHPHDRQRVEEAIDRACRHGEPYDQEFRVVRTDGQVLWLRDRGKASLDEQGQPYLMTGGAIEITSRKESEQLLQRVNEELRQTNEEMAQFVYTVSHDLKSPLVTTTGFIGLLREDLSEGRDEDVTDSVDRIERATRRMGELIDDLLELSRIGRVPYDPEQIDVTQLVQRIAEDLEERLQEVGATLEIQPQMPRVVCDQTRLGEVFENLLSNAIKYACSSPGVCIQVGAEQAEDEVRFYVRDNGPGVPPEYHQKIFGLFQRLHNDSSGTGVGLAVVARVAQVHGGRSWVESAPGEGATFWIALPQKTSLKTTDSPVA